MGTPATTPTQPDSRKLTAIAPWADSLSKAIAAVAIGLYACGFLIVSLYHSKYGFVGINPFRPRILAAGTWFCMFLVIPTAVAIKYRTLPWSTVARVLVLLLFGGFAVSLSISYVLFQVSDGASLMGCPLWLYLGGAPLYAAIIVGQQFKKLPRQSDTVVSVLLTCAIVTFLLREVIGKHLFGPGAVALWFFGVTLVTIYGLKQWTAELSDPLEWGSKLLPPVFVTLLVFSQTYYSHLRASWGGGAPVDVTICFTKDSAISPNKAVSAQLIDEADEGFYVVGPNDSKAIFIPRSAVAFIYFSNKMSDSQMLRENK
jgi:hypothetical protein